MPIKLSELEPGFSAEPSTLRAILLPSRPLRQECGTGNLPLSLPLGEEGLGKGAPRNRQGEVLEPQT